MSEVESAFTRLVDHHRQIGSRIPEYLRPPASEQDVARAGAELGVVLPPDVVALYRLADGVDHERWYQEPRILPELLPEMEFPGLAASVAVTRRMRAAAAWSERPDYLWRPSWFPVLPMYPDENVVVDCADPGGEVWVVRWVDDEIRPSAPDLARFLSRGLDRMRQVGVGVAEGGFGLVVPEEAENVSFW